MAADSKKLILSAALVIAVAVGAVAAQTAPARRVVSLVPAVTEMLFAIGAGPQVAAVSSYDEYPPEVSGLPRVGALLDPDVERILSLRPDLVITYGTQTSLQSQLGRAHVPVFDYRHAGLEGLFDTLRRLGPAVGRSTEAERVVNDLRRQLDDVRRRVGGRAHPRTLLVFGREPDTLRGLYVSGGRGFLHEMLEIAGGANVFGDVAREAVQPSQETLLGRAPDVIIELQAKGLSDSTDAAAAERRAWSRLSSIPAVRSGRVYLLSGDYLVVPGPRVGKATEALARTLHPGAFQ